jgi:microcystin-dependent protein
MPLLAKEGPHMDGIRRFIRQPIGRLALYVALPVAIVATAAMFAGAYDTTWIANGQALSAMKLKADLDEVQVRLQALEAAAIPSGTIVAYGGAASPAGWVLCDGKKYNALDPTYTALYGAIGTAYGGDMNAQDFNVPDLQGRFIRGADNQSGHDLDAAGRTALALGGNTGGIVGSIQSGATASPLTPFQTSQSGTHDHTYSTWPMAAAYSCANGCNMPFMTFNQNSMGQPTATSSDGAHTHTVQGGGDRESRPENVAVNYIIKL